MLMSSKRSLSFRFADQNCTLTSDLFIREYVPLRPHASCLYLSKTFGEESDLIPYVQKSISLIDD